MFSGHSFGVVEAEYGQQADKNLLVIVQIESQSGVDEVEEIAKVDGLDVLFIGELHESSSMESYLPTAGPFDLAKQMKVQHGGQEHEAAIKRTLDAAHAAGKTAAIFCECTIATVFIRLVITRLIGFKVSQANKRNNVLLKVSIWYRSAPTSDRS
jgi:2-keto-3-deoxy-L-rhamnonate aldolase RhmA